MRSLRARSESAENQSLGRLTRLGGGARRIKPNESPVDDDGAPAPAPSPAADLCFEQAWQATATSDAGEVEHSWYCDDRVCVHGRFLNGVEHAMIHLKEGVN